MAEEQEISGYVERITFSHPETGFTVAKLKEPRKSDLTTLVGCLPGIHAGLYLHCKGKWLMHPDHGWQFDVCHFVGHTPHNEEGIQRYLGSGLIKGIGAYLATKIVEKYGKETLEVIEKSPDVLLEVHGIGAKRLAMIRRSWDEQKAIREVMLFLQPFEVSPSFAQKIYRKYKEDSIAKVKENPYRLAHEVHGIGFKSADRMAQKMGFTLEHPQRIAAGIEFVLHELAGDGHTCYPTDELQKHVHEILQVPLELIDAQVRGLIGEGRLIQEGLRVWLKVSHICEKGIATQFQRLLESVSFLRSIEVERAISWAEEKLKIELADNQRLAVEAALTNKLQVITGGPGTGKSTITKVILAISRRLTQRIILAAPTGKAAKRMAEVTHMEAKTIHSLLEFSFEGGGFKRNRENPLEADLIIIDEASMIDQYLMYSLLRAIPNHARVILIGDVNQLPSVGPGTVLKDIIESKILPVVCLVEIFRQAQGSMIITNAHRIHQGLFPEIEIKKGSDFFFIKANEPEDLVKEVLSLVKERLPKRYRLNPFDDIQVLVPMKRGPVGTERFNVLLQETLNPNQPSVEWGHKKFCLHDKVMQIRNNYTKEVYNGDVGRIIAIDPEEQELLVSFDGKDVPYEFLELDELVLAYAVSVHKYQGSECPCVVIPVHTSHYMLLHKNLLYTAVTRGKRLVILVGMARAIHIAIHNDHAQERHTGLLESLQSK